MGRRCLVACFLLMLIFQAGCILNAAAQGSASVLILYDGHGRNDYLGEILKTEGFHDFVYQDVNDSRFSPEYLATADLVIVPKITLAAAKLAVLTGYLKAGGSALVFCPQSPFPESMGVRVAGKSLDFPYVQFDSTAGTGSGLVSRPLQCHDSTMRFQIVSSKARPIAHFCDSFRRNSGFPAAVISSVGKGHVISFAYDPSYNILLTRQGNPALAARETDGINGVRAMDMFTGGWVDTANNTVNQADEQMRFLSGCIEALTGGRMPQPRTWYFPDSLRSVIVLTNDGEFRAGKDFAAQFEDVKAKAGRMTLYVLSPEKIDSLFVDSAVRNGFEIAAHPDATAEAGNPGWSGVDSAIKQKSADMRRFPGVAPILTNTNHWFVWCGKDSLGALDFSAGAKLEAANGIRLDINYAHYDNKASQERFLGPTGYRQGNFTGSGLPMKFGTAGLKTIDVYQLFNNVYDQEYMENKDPEGYEAAFRGILDRSLQDEVFSCICIRSHNDEYFFSKAPLMRMLDYAKVSRVPVWTAKRLLGFLSARDNIQFRNLKWKNGRLSFRIESETDSRDAVSILLPEYFGGRRAYRVRLNDSDVRLSLRRIRGKSYVWVSYNPGKKAVIAADYR